MKLFKKLALAIVLPGGILLLGIELLIWLKKLPDNFWSLTWADKGTVLKSLVTPKPGGFE